MAGRARWLIHEASLYLSAWRLRRTAVTQAWVAEVVGGKGKLGRDPLASGGRDVRLDIRVKETFPPKALTGLHSQATNVQGRDGRIDERNIIKLQSEKAAVRYVRMLSSRWSSVEALGGRGG